MTVVRGRAQRRWALVAAGVAALCAAPVVVAALPVTAAAVPAGELRAKMVASADLPYSAFAESSGTLGLPALPQLSDVTSLLSGTTQTRVWHAGPGRERVDVIGSVGGERDVYETPEGEFSWDYGANLVTRIVGTSPVRLPRAGDLLPPDLARRVLALDPGDPVTALPARRVAGIGATGLRLSPADPATTVGRVDIWADPASGLPLRVEITPKGADAPVLVSQFVDLSQAPPPAATLEPPDPADAGYTNTDVPDVLTALGNLPRRTLPATLAGYAEQPGLASVPSIGRYGAGLATFAVVPLPGGLGASAVDAVTKAGAVPVPEPAGRALAIQIPLLSVLVEQAGFGRRTYLLAGTVQRAVLQRAAAELALLRGPRR